jgi:hypothetical protein
MNPKIKKTRDELERTKVKIIELQALVPQLERSITDMENTEIIRLVRSADVALADLPAFIASLKNTNAAVSVHEPAETYATATDSRDAGSDSDYINYEEDSADV